jgi:hypothetical protein
MGLSAYRRASIPLERLPRPREHVDISAAATTVSETGEGEPS